MAYDDRDRVIAWLAEGHGDKLTTLDRAILTTIAHHANSHTGHSWKGVDYLAAVWGVDGRSARRSITRLHRLGYLETAERGTGQRRARYRLAGELIDTQVGGHSGPPTSTEEGGPKQQSRGTETTKKQDLGVPRISESSRSYSGEMTTDGATPRPPKGSAGAAPTEAVKQQISQTLNYTPEETTAWIEDRLTGRQVSNVDAYLLSCLNNHVADTAKTPAARGSTKASRKPVPAKAAAKPSKKTSSKTAGKFTCPRCNRDFPTAKSLSSHDGHCRTTQCPVCNTTIKTRDLGDHHKRIHRAAFIRSIQDMPPCPHGTPGGNLPEPLGPSALWRNCSGCRTDAMREHYGGPAGQVCEYWVPGIGKCKSAQDVRLYPGHRYRCPDHTPEALAERKATPTFSMTDWQAEKRSGATDLSLNDWLIEKPVNGRQPLRIFHGHRGLSGKRLNWLV
jgi:hypothetical protein